MYIFWGTFEIFWEYIYTNHNFWKIWGAMPSTSFVSIFWVKPRLRLSKSRSYVGLWEVGGIVDHKIRS